MPNMPNVSNNNDLMQGFTTTDIESHGDEELEVFGDRIGQQNLMDKLVVR